MRRNVKRDVIRKSVTIDERHQSIPQHSARSRAYAREMQRAMKVAATTRHARFAKELRHLPSKKENLSSTPWRAKTYRQLRSPTNLEDISCGMRTTQVDLGTCCRRQVAGFNLSSRTKDKATWGRGAYLKIPHLIPGVPLLPDYYILTMRKNAEEIMSRWLRLD